jgi:hypothetical protein
MKLSPDGSFILAMLEPFRLKHDPKAEGPDVSEAVGSEIMLARRLV